MITWTESAKTAVNQIGVECSVRRILFAPQIRVETEERASRKKIISCKLFLVAYANKYRLSKFKTMSLGCLFR